MYFFLLAGVPSAYSLSNQSYVLYIPNFQNEMIETTL